MRLSVPLAILASLAVANGLNVGPRLSQRSKVVSPREATAIPLPPTALDVPKTVPSLPKLQKEDAWIANLDYDSFGKEVTALGKKLLKEGGDEDVQHLEKIVGWRNLAAAIGVATMWMTPNPLTILALSTWTYASWTMIAHHTCHGGYNRVNAGKFNSRGFALGSVKKRVEDWLDWMHPEAWNIEHNRLHHYRLNENQDPDLVQRNLEFSRDMKAPMFIKYGIVAFVMPLWKWLYYAPNTLKELQVAKMIKEGQELPKGFDPQEAVTVTSMLTSPEIRKIVSPQDLVAKVLGPFLMARFVLLPAPLLLIPGVGPTLFGHALVNLILAEAFTNIHAFTTIVTNHAGEDLYTFDDAVKPKTGSFYVRQIIGSANYDAGGDLLDFSHGWLNYQIEHHVWPDLSMLQYQKGAPQLKAICEKHGVPYVQENVFERLRKTVDIMVGKTTMRKFPTEYEPTKDKALNGVTWKSTNGAIDEE